DYLRKFFGLWSEDAVVLAKVFGYNTEEEPETYDDNWYDNYIQNKVDAVSIMKSVVIDKSEEEINKAIAELSPEDYLKIVKSQEIFEKNLDQAIAEVKKSSGKTEGVTEPKGSNSPAVEKSKNEESMTEFISKSALDGIVAE